MDTWVSGCVLGMSSHALHPQGVFPGVGLFSLASLKFSDLGAGATSSGHSSDFNTPPA